MEMRVVTTLSTYSMSVWGYRSTLGDTEIHEYMGDLEYHVAL
jgi:hypothetical protein